MSREPTRDARRVADGAEEGERRATPDATRALERVGVGIIGCGNISGAYLRSAREQGVLDVRAVADIDMDLARERAAEHGVPAARTPDELLADEAIELVVNLTVPSAHAAVSRRALEAGKHVYSEKPLATTRADGRPLLDLAEAKGLRIGEIGRAHV